jgi:hypothetical protein
VADADTKTPPALLCAAYDEIRAFLTGVQGLLLELQNDPEEAAIERALRTLALLREGLETGAALRQDARNLRDALVGHLAQAAPSLTMKIIADAAGYNDSYASRVARQYGAQPRAKRASRTPPTPRD